MITLEKFILSVKALLIKYIGNSKVNRKNKTEKKRFFITTKFLRCLFYLNLINYYTKIRILFFFFFFIFKILLSYFFI